MNNSVVISPSGVDRHTGINLSIIYKSTHYQISGERRTKQFLNHGEQKHPRYANINTMNFTTNRYMYQEGQRGHWHVMKRAGGYMVLQEVCSSLYEARKRVWELNGWKKKQQNNKIIN